MKIKFAYILAISICFISSSYAVEKWHFEKTYETERLTERPFYLFATADLNHNGKSEILVADFGMHGNHNSESTQWFESETEKDFMFAVLEWDGSKLNVNLKKIWTESEMNNLWYRFEIEQLLVLKGNSGITVEAEPAYFGIEWEHNKYIFHEQRERPRLTGSWIYPWQSPSCNTEFGGKKWPIECLYGIRDFLVTAN
ncbi:MAG: hypothetical protein HZB31_06240 [Nitrospirae bacterium]|nr:hypothetical protein [Nitrospirota bacterium]